jgi:formate hydrogenlyase subunit 3/multisubunit Na+/H+ antiporter MnhD subunit
MAMSIFLLAVVCLLTGIALRFLRRWPRLVFVAVLFGALNLFAILTIAPDEAFYFFGRALILNTSTRALLAPVLGVTVALALFGPLAFTAPGTTSAQILINSQSAFLFWALAPLVFAITFDSFPLAIFFWAIGLIALVLLASPQRAGRVGGAAQFLLVTVIAATSLLLASRVLDLYPLTPENFDLVRVASVLLALGLGLLLAIAPFQIWLGPFADEMPILGTAFLTGVAQPLGIWLLFQRMSDLVWLTERAPVLTILFIGGALTALAGAALAISERRDGRLVAYLALVALGHALIGVGLGTRAALIGAWLILLSRGLGIALFAGGLSFARHHSERRWQITGAIAILGGGIAIAGAPLAPGFAALWVIYRAVAATNMPVFALLIVSNAMVLLASVRLAWTLIAQSENVASDEIKIVPYLGAGVVIVLLALVILTGLAPQSIANALNEMTMLARYLK